MLKKLNKLLYETIGLSIVMFIIGLMFTIKPETSFEMVTCFLAVVLIIGGLYFLFERETSIFFSGFVTLGVLEILLGIVMLLNPDIVKSLFPIVTGIVMITKSFLDFRICILLIESGYKEGIYPLICSIISILCGLFIVFYPHLGAMAITIYFGITLMLYAISNIINTIIFKKNLNSIVKLLSN